MITFGLDDDEWDHHSLYQDFQPLCPRVIRVRVRVKVRVLYSRFITRLVLRSLHPRPSRREVTRTPNSHKFNKSKFRSGSNKSLVCCYGVIIPTELLHLRHGLSLLIGIHQPPLVADFCRSMTPLTQHVYVLVS